MKGNGRRGRKVKMREPEEGKKRVHGRRDWRKMKREKRVRWK